MTPSPHRTRGAAAGDDEDALGYGRWLFAQTCEFVRGAAIPDQMPATRLPEVAFAGRSNVGKSSLINALTGRRTLARVSNTPGRTREINFFCLGKALMLADLPGYGYARAPKGRIGRWVGTVEAYLKGRAGLRRALLLIDARHGPKESDDRAMALMDAAAVAYQVVLTKCDKVTVDALADRIDAIARALVQHPAAHPRVLATSVRAGTGIDELRAEIARLARR